MFNREYIFKRVIFQPAMLVYQRVMSLEYLKMDTKNDGLGKAVSLYLRQMSVVTRMGVTDPWAATDARTEYTKVGTLGLENWSSSWAGGVAMFKLSSYML